MRLLPYAWGMALAVVLTGGMIHAKFCIVDDHYEASWLGARHVFSFSQIWPALLRSEVGHLGSGGRFRPIYILYLELETWLLGDRVSLYHAARVIYFGLFLGAMTQAATRCIGLVAALALVLAVSGLHFWDNLWTLSFGPAEQIAIVGVSLLIVAGEAIIPRLTSGDRVPGWALPLASIGVAIAAGSKENFVFLLVVLGGLALALALARNLRRGPVVMAAPPLVIPALVAYDLLTAARAKQDFYGADNSIGHRLSQLLSLPQMATPPFLLPSALAGLVLAAIVAAIACKASPLPVQQRQRAILVLLGAVAVLAVYVMWEIFFYDGRLPSGIRYDFPSLLLPLAMILAIAGFSRYSIFPRGGWRWQIAKSALAVLAGLYLYQCGITFSLPAAVDAAVARTTSFASDFEAMRRIASRHPDWPIVLEPNSPWDFEVVQSFAAWATYFGVPNPVLLNVRVPAKAIADGFERYLTDTMRGWAEQGYPGIVGALRDPRSLDSLGRRCFAIGFWQPASSPCVPLSFHPGRYIPHG